MKMLTLDLYVATIHVGPLPPIKMETYHRAKISQTPLAPLFGHLHIIGCGLDPLFFHLISWALFPTSVTFQTGDTGIQDKSAFLQRFL